MVCRYHMSPVIKVKKEEYNTGLAIGCPNSVKENRISLFLSVNQKSEELNKEKGTWIYERHPFLVGS